MREERQHLKKRRGVSFTMSGRWRQRAEKESLETQQRNMVSRLLKRLDYKRLDFGVEQLRKIDQSGTQTKDLRINVPALYQLSCLALCWWLEFHLGTSTHDCRICSSKHLLDQIICYKKLTRITMRKTRIGLFTQFHISEDLGYVIFLISDVQLVKYFNT